MDSPTPSESDAFGEGRIDDGEHLIPGRIVGGRCYQADLPALAWLRASPDPEYRSMSAGLALLGSKVATLQSQLPPLIDYVSLGPGDGSKDSLILRALEESEDRLRFFIPADISQTILRAATHALRHHKALRSRTLAVQLDLEVDTQLATLGDRLRVFDGVGPGAVHSLFSLLGNTLGNFDNDGLTLAGISNSLLRPDDRLLLEVSTTADLSEDAAQLLANEYTDNRGFCSFIREIFRAYSSLDYDARNLQIFPNVNRSESTIEAVALYSDRGSGTLREGPSVELHRTKRYHPQRIAELLQGASLTVFDSWTASYGSINSPFGVQMLLVGREG